MTKIARFFCILLIFVVVAAGAGINCFELPKWNLDDPARILQTTFGIVARGSEALASVGAAPRFFSQLSSASSSAANVIEHREQLKALANEQVVLHKQGVIKNQHPRLSYDTYIKPTYNGWHISEIHRPGWSLTNIAHESNRKKAEFLLQALHDLSQVTHHHGNNDRGRYPLPSETSSAADDDVSSSEEEDTAGGVSGRQTGMSVYERRLKEAKEAVEDLTEECLRNTDHRTVADCMKHLLVKHRSYFQHGEPSRNISAPLEPVALSRIDFTSDLGFKVSLGNIQVYGVSHGFTDDRLFISLLQYPEPWSMLSYLRYTILLPVVNINGYFSIDGKAVKLIFADEMPAGELGYLGKHSGSFRGAIKFMKASGDGYILSFPDGSAMAANITMSFMYLDWSVSLRSRRNPVLTQKMEAMLNDKFKGRSLLDQMSIPIADSLTSIFSQIFTDAYLASSKTKTTSTAHHQQGRVSVQMDSDPKNNHKRLRNKNKQNLSKYQNISLSGLLDLEAMYEELFEKLNTRSHHHWSWEEFSQQSLPGFKPRSGFEAKKYSWLCGTCGGAIGALGLAYLAVYFSIRNQTSSVQYFETVPTIVPASLLLVTGLLVGCFIRKPNRTDLLTKLAGLSCLTSAVVCVVVTITTTVVHMNRLQTLRECVYTPQARACACFSAIPDPSASGNPSSNSNEPGGKFVFAGTESCDVIHGSLYTCLRVLFGVSVVAIILCIFSCMLTYQLVRLLESATDVMSSPAQESTAGCAAQTTGQAGSSRDHQDGNISSGWRSPQDETSGTEVMTPGSQACTEESSAGPSSMGNSSRSIRHSILSAESIMDPGPRSRRGMVGSASFHMGPGFCHYPVLPTYQAEDTCWGPPPPYPDSSGHSDNGSEASPALGSRARRISGRKLRPTSYPAASAVRGLVYNNLPQAGLVQGKRTRRTVLTGGRPDGRGGRKFYGMDVTPRQNANARHHQNPSSGQPQELFYSSSAVSQERAETQSPALTATDAEVASFFTSSAVIRAQGQFPEPEGMDHQVRVWRSSPGHVGSLPLRMPHRALDKVANQAILSCDNLPLFTGQRSSFSLPARAQIQLRSIHV
ncbi:unnamed protein product [Notodromas monacha]|uniref:Transmembrane protein n=1 Tax=Notodromas monacha TaxID=399045 RepID=A0A7R9BCA4_9CRUS|nr:unnamed protein product [Notodromas monacha]CAG0912630.1 unnamed protein product [Notodromas monacha]